MGNTTSSNEPVDIKSLSTHIDDIAVHYILKQNTIDLLRLTDKEYYDNLIILIGDLFQKRLSDMEIGSLNQRIFPETIQDVLNMMPTSGKVKDEMIRNISKFYIKIMMIFSAVVATIDPQYSYEDASGQKQLFYLKDLKSYKQIPRHVQPTVHQLTNPMNLCRKRISILRNKIDFSDPDFITINPGEKMCTTDSAEHLTDEIGIKELDLLYYDIFDPETKSWKGRSKEMEAKYQDDLKKFYTIFTGKEMPKTITSFKDIELFDFKSIEYCRDPLFTHDFIVPKDNELIIRYKEQVDLLEKSTMIYRNELLENLKKIFLTKMDQENMTYTIHPTLTLQDILVIEKDTRNSIINLYTNCEQYFIRAMLIFEELYDSQSKVLNESRISNLDERKNVPLYKENMININTPFPVAGIPVAGIPVTSPVSESMAKNMTETIPEPIPISNPVSESIVPIEPQTVSQNVTRPEPQSVPQSVPQSASQLETQPASQTPEGKPIIMATESVATNSIAPQSVATNSVAPQSIPTNSVSTESVSANSVATESKPSSQELPQSLPPTNTYVPPQPSLPSPQDSQSPLSFPTYSPTDAPVVSPVITSVDSQTTTPPESPVVNPIETAPNAQVESIPLSPPINSPIESPVSSTNSPPINSPTDTSVKNTLTPPTNTLPTDTPLPSNSSVQTPLESPLQSPLEPAKDSNTLANSPVNSPTETPISIPKKIPFFPQTNSVPNTMPSIAPQSNAPQSVSQNVLPPPVPQGTSPQAQAKPVPETESFIEKISNLWKKP